MHRSRPAIAALLVAIIATACAAGPAPVGPPPSSPAPAPDLRPVVDQAPYWCEYIPQEAFRRISGITQPLTEEKDGPWKDDGGCLLSGNGTEPVGVWWSRIDNSAARLKLVRENWQHTDQIPLPSEIGDGFAAHADNDMLSGRPYYVISRFTCGKKKPWIRIDLETVVKGRDAIKDLTDLMRIAQKRYGHLHNCSPGPV
ncbi:hypothetical protein [Nonomuraea insulae]|uniref:DUF3558 domain-containing protein n=1 Tax=Nonomuraea insulae TaxID=1616787 RepID=A0ABW1CYG7_9ACTN